METLDFDAISDLVIFHDMNNAVRITPNKNVKKNMISSFVFRDISQAVGFSVNSLVSEIKGQ